MMKLQLLRNATQLLNINNKIILVDPMLAPKGSYDPIPNTDNTLRNPLVDLPLNDQELSLLIERTDAVLLTHVHNDHWDKTAQQLVPPDTTIFCQPEDVNVIRQAGFINVFPIGTELIWNDISFSRTRGRHGTGEIGERMGTVSGYFIQYQEESVYIAGDTIWCEEVKNAIDQYDPKRIVLNGGAARFITGDPIVMDINDMITVCNYAPEAKIYVVHLETVNHSSESREEIRLAIEHHRLSSGCMVPDDGDQLF